MPLSPTPPTAHMQLHTYPVASGSSLGESVVRLLPLRSSPVASPVAGLRRSVDDSDAEADAQEPPKKKRRRQALSCTGAAYPLI